MLLIVTVALPMGGAAAQDWPTKPVKVIVSQAAGSTPDIVCRLLADRLSQRLGQVFVVDNRPGGANVVGSQAAARSAADGYNFFFATAAALVTNPHTFKNLPYDPARDFEPVAMVAQNPFLILAHPAVPASTLDEVIALAKKDPGALSIVTEGPRTFTGILAAWLNKSAGTSILEVPYNSPGNAVQDAIAGRVQLLSLPIPSAVPHIKSGALKPVAVSSRAPMPGFEKIPPIADTLPGIELVGWLAIVAPAGTPREASGRLNRALDAVLKEPPIGARFSELGLYTEGAGTVEAAKAFVAEQDALFARVVKEIGLEPE